MSSGLTTLLRADDDLLRTVVQLARAQGATISLLERDGSWSTAATGEVPLAWGSSAVWSPPTSTTPILDRDGRRSGTLLTFGGEPPETAALASLLTIGSLVAGCTGTLDRAASDTSHLVVVDAVGRLRAVSPHIAGVLGRVPEDVIGVDVFSVIHESDHASTLDSLLRMSTVRGERFPTDVRFVHADGTNRVLETLAIDPVDPTATDLVFLVRETVTRDTADLVVSEQARLLAMIGRGAPVGDVLTETARLFEQHTGFIAGFLLVDDDTGTLHTTGGRELPAPLVQRLDGEPLHAPSTTCAIAAARGTMAGCADITVDDGWRRRSARAGLGELEVRSCWAAPVRSASGRTVFGVLAMFGPLGRSITPTEVRLSDLAVGIAAVAIERSRVEVGRVRQAMHDPVTGLPNRALFLDRLAQALTPRPDRRRHTAVMFLDLDRFKVVNDALGHEAGDELLVAVADRFRSVLRPSETVARFGGDEFTVLCEQLDSPRDAMVLAERLVASLSTPLPLGAGEVTMGVSVGVAVADDVTDPNALLRDADAAMYRAKERGRNRVELFDHTMRELALARLELERSFRTSLERGDFALELQPEYRLGTGRVCGAEALLRWHHPTRGLVAPSDFIPIAEETGAILPLGDWVLEQACVAVHLHHAPSRVEPDFAVWVNVSVVQLMQPDFAERMEEIVTRSGVDPTRIGIEITESAFLTDADRSVAALSRLRAAGLRVAIDDFGTGWSSLAYLRRLPVDVVKLDRSFVVDVETDERSRSIVRGVVHLAAAVGCTTTAEGIETPGQLRVLTELGCDAGQGFWLARPAPPDRAFPRIDGIEPAGALAGQTTSSSSSSR